MEFKYLFTEQTIKSITLKNKKMTFKDFSSFDHILVNGTDELFRKENKYKHFNYHKGWTNYLTINLTATDNNVTKIAFLMTADDLPNKSILMN